MRKFIIMLSMSLCTFAEAQKAIEWQVKLGLYSDVFSFPKIKEGLEWNGAKTYAYFTTSIGLEIKKWKTLIQLNADSKLTFWNSNINWKIDRATSIRIKNNSQPLTEIGDLVQVSYTYFSILNTMYKITKDENKNKIYIGLGLVGRYDSIDSIAYISDPIAGFPVILDGYNKYRYAPALKAEYQYDISKKFFLSIHVLYGFFDVVPHSYWQFALNGGIRF
jgi:hypothetical protein